MLLTSKGVFALAAVGLALGCSPVYSTAPDPAPTYRAGTAYGPPGGGAASYQAPPSATYADTEPPAPIAEDVPARPYDGAVWVDGYWHWNGTEWIWISGRWVADRDDHVYVEPYYDYSDAGGYCTYVPGYWTHSSYIPTTVVVINDHRYRPRRVHIRPRHARRHNPRNVGRGPKRGVDHRKPRPPGNRLPPRSGFDRFGRNKNPHRRPPVIPRNPRRPRALGHAGDSGRDARVGRADDGRRTGSRDRIRSRRPLEAPDRSARDRHVGRPDRPLPRRERTISSGRNGRVGGTSAETPQRSPRARQRGGRTIVIMPRGNHGVRGQRPNGPRGDRRAAPSSAPRGQRGVRRGSRSRAPQRSAPPPRRAAPSRSSRGSRSSAPRSRGSRSSAPRSSRSSAPRSRGNRSSAPRSRGNRGGSSRSSGSHRTAPSRSSHSSHGKRR